MKMRNPKNPNLSRKQSTIWESLNASQASREQVSNLSGVCMVSISFWLNGTNEPTQSNFKAVMQAITILNNKEVTA